MGLNPRVRGRRGKGRRGGPNGPGGGGGGGGMGMGMGMGPQGPMFRGGPPGPMFGPPPMGFPPGPPFPGGPPMYWGPCGSNFGQRRPPGYGKFPRKNYKQKSQQQQQKNNNNAKVLEIDLTKPWVTDEIKAEEGKKQECLETWRKSKDDTDWSKYKEQKQLVQTLYDKAKAEYMAKKPEEAHLWSDESASERSLQCDACDKSFREERQLYLHEMDHETCGRDGCTYSAHPKLVAKHVRVQHDTGLYKRMGRLKTAEDIAKWVEERKRRYPTRKVVEDKKAAEEEKAKRGERIKDDNRRFNKTFTKKGRKAVKERRPRRRRREAKVTEVSVSEALKEETSCRGSIPPFCGIGTDDPSEDTDKISDDEWDTSSAAPKPTAKPVSSSLGLLAACYDSNASSEDEEGMQVDDNADAPEEVKTIHVKEDPVVTAAEVTKPRTEAKKKRKRGLSQRDEDNSNNNEDEETHLRRLEKVRRREPTLLEKLLAKEIRHERNVILQCIRYIVDNNFFKGAR